MIKRIELVNFMSHTHTVIEPAAGLTVLVGPNNCGKSAVMSALQILCHNDTSTYVTRHGEKDCSIVIETMEGDVIQWNRRRNTTKYIINGETFDRLRGNVPPVLLDVLRLPKVKLDQSPDEFDIHFGNQKDPVFLINESGRAAAGFFAASSDASRLIEMQKLHSQKVKEAVRDQHRLDSEASDLSSTIERLQDVPKLQQRFSECNDLIRSIRIHDKAMAELKTTLSEISSVQQAIGKLSTLYDVASTLTDPPKLHPTGALSDLTNSIVEKSKQRDLFGSYTATIRSLNEPPRLTQTDALEKSINDIVLQNRKINVATRRAACLTPIPVPPTVADSQSLKGVVTQIKDTQSEILLRKKELEIVDQSFGALDAMTESFIANNPTCPTCRQQLSKQHLSAHMAGEANEI